MIAYSLILFFVAAIFVGIGIAIYRGKTNWIHDYHQTNVTDPAAYGKAMGKALFVFAADFLLSGIIALFDNRILLADAVLFTA